MHERFDKGNPRLINAWALYDWANSVYQLVIASTIFPIYYEAMTRHGDSDLVMVGSWGVKNTALFAYSLAAAQLILAMLTPVLSGVADYSGRKKRFMQAFCYLGALSCALMATFTAENVLWGLALSMAACIGYSGSVVFYNAYLPEIAAPEDQDRVSAKGYAFGYIGSCLLLIANLAMIMKPDWFGGISKDVATKLAFISVGLWWWGFAQITFHFLPEPPPSGHLPISQSIRLGYGELRKVWRELQEQPLLWHFLAAFFVYNMGVQTVMRMATFYGTKEIHMATEALIITILIIQFVAIVGAHLFARLSARRGNVFTLEVATATWIGICVAAYFTTTTVQFYGLAFAVGLVMGGIQSMSRSTFAKMLDDEADHASYFSLFDVCDKVGVVLGMLVFGLFEAHTDSMRNPILALISFFVVGWLMLRRLGRMHAPTLGAAEPVAAN